MFCPVTKLATQLIRLPSFSPKDAGCQNIIIDRLLSVGFKVERMNFSDTENFWAWHGQCETKTLVFAGHTDIVPVDNPDYWINSSPLESTIMNGLLFGRGAADMKGSIAAMIVAVERFIALYPKHKGRLAFIITSDEETSAKNGTVKVVEKLMARNERLDYCLIGEPSSTRILGDVIKNGRRGSLNCNLTIHGIQRHVAYANSSDNLIHLILPVLKELTKIEWDRGNKFFTPTSMQVTSIESRSISNNTTPSHLFLKLNFRFNTELTDDAIKTKVINILEKYQLKYVIYWDLSGQPFFTAKGKLVDVVARSISYFNKIKPRILTTGGTSDGRFIAQTGAQIVEFGLVNATIHKINECVSISDLQLLSLIYQRIIEQLLIFD